MGLLDSVVKSAKQAEHITIGVKTKFDSISTAAYSKEIAEETIQEFSDMAPGELNSKQKVRFMEILAASMPEDQISGTVFQCGKPVQYIGLNFIIIVLWKQYYGICNQIVRG